MRPESRFVAFSGLGKGRPRRYGGWHGAQKMMQSSNALPVINVPHPALYHTSPSPTYYDHPASHSYHGPDAGGTNTIHGFSEGSPSSFYQDHEYPYFVDSGEISTSIPPPIPPTQQQHATGMTHPGNLARPYSDLYPEDVSPYQRLWPSTSAHGFDPAPLADPLGTGSSFGGVKSTPSSISQQEPCIPSPTPTLPTPSEMAIILGPNGGSGREASRMPSAPPPLTMVHEINGAARQQMMAGDDEAAFTRERKHACTMCHKRFDRPSTLKKHLLVHTAFQCETCGRRFGVASNLNRHVRRCILKPVNARHSSSGSPEASSRGRSTSSSPPRNTVASARPAAQKRRRRAPSPSRWIPNSLRNFVLEAPVKTSCIPLPPVRPSQWEERNSYDENVGSAPYHPREWQYNPKLPGPGLFSGSGLGNRDVRNLGFGGGHEGMLGLLVF
ncbi:hypothetical protein VNI00_017973 [Paramarasmius palmivorus]|uniref:C2H2-type domain-containing protein n=1 Tax=Paramarasmius palmivorus TaxID=297713 RepID=A0AAW0B561_9AGAR